MQIETSPHTPVARNASSFAGLDEAETGDWRPGHQSRARPRRKLDAFLLEQREKLLELREALVGSMNGAARETRLEKADGSAFATHNGDAGSDACDRDLVLCLLSQESNALFEIDEALKRIEAGTYGICEISGRRIPIARLRALPFARFTVEFQEKIEQRRKLFSRPRPMTEMAALFDQSEAGEIPEDDRTRDGSVE